jgi:hypothetical protein
VAAVTHELADAGRFDSAAGQQAVELARQMVAPWQFGSVVAAPQASGHRRLRVGLLCRPIAGGGMCGSDGPPQAHHPTLVGRGPRSHWSFRRRTSPDDFLATEAQGLPFSLVDRLVAVCANVERLRSNFATLAFSRVEWFTLCQAGQSRFTSLHAAARPYRLLTAHRPSRP